MLHESQEQYVKEIALARSDSCYSSQTAAIYATMHGLDTAFSRDKIKMRENPGFPRTKNLRENPGLPKQILSQSCNCRNIYCCVPVKRK
jgi:hypothetical protein